ncbi:MAG: O-antigen ligase family protein [Anaerolineae bacterium]|nr:O-antigen ligase family protein [Anaerolineae bacterium]
MLLAGAYYFGGQLDLPKLSIPTLSSNAAAAVEDISMADNANFDNQDIDTSITIDTNTDVMVLDESDSNDSPTHTETTESKGFTFALQEAKQVVKEIISQLTAPTITSKPFQIVGWFIYFVGLVAIVYRPRYGIYLIILLALAGDSVLSPWYPFVKGFSSRESLFFVNDSLIISPVETYIIVTFVSWFGRQFKNLRFNVYMGPLFWPAMVFLGFVVFGLIYGIATGGSINVALWEARAIFYLVAMLVLTGNILETPKQMSTLLWVAMAALCLEGFAATLYYFLVLNRDLSQLQSTNEHSAAIHLNTLFVLIVAVWLFRASLTKRIILPMMVPFVMFGYIAMQRRAAFLSLAIVMVLMTIILYQERRRLFWRLAPIMIVLGMIYVVGFWNSSSSLALPVQAVKSVIASNQAGNEDQLSNDYRLLENQNISYTIHQHPLTGVGFGQKFYIIAPMPDISWFEWWEYITHNSIAWIWMKTGLAGFLAMVFLVGVTVVVGTQTLFLLTTPDTKAIALTATLFVIMHFVFAYADMSWDSQSMIYLGVMMGLLNGLNRLVGSLEPQPHKQPARSLILNLRNWPRLTF